VCKDPVFNDFNKISNQISLQLLKVKKFPSSKMQVKDYSTSDKIVPLSLLNIEVN